MSSWSSRFGFGRFSPFGRSSAAPHVTDEDFSYITKEDLDRTTAASKANRPPRDTDVLVIRHHKISYPIHFPAYSIDDGDLLIGDVKVEAAKKLGVKDPSKIKLFYKGRNLKENSSKCRDEGFRSDLESEILCVVGEPLVRPEESSSESEEDDEVSSAVRELEGAAAAKKKKNRSHRKRKHKKASGASTPSTLNVPETHTSSAQSSRPTTPAPPQTPMQKLDAIASTFHATFVPECIKFTSNPPSDPAKRAYEHKRLTETILAQILLKLDGVDVEGDQDARARRKELVREVQAMLSSLDEVAK